MEKPLVLEAPAKINLVLGIKGKRADGYHELETVMHQISLVDRVYLQPGGSGIRVRSSNSEVPDNEENLAYRAAWLLYSEFSLTEGIEIFLEKNIPVGAGLAGGSTDAAAALKGINRLYNLKLTPSSLMEMGQTLGSDVPFCLMGGTALARGRGEILTPLPQRSLELVVVKPDFQISTAEIYRAFRMDLVDDHPDTAAFIKAWAIGEVSAIAANSKNVLETVSANKYSEIGKIKKQLFQLGALNAVMSGSGPSVFGIFPDQVKARQAWEIMRKDYQEAYLLSSYE